MPRTKSKKEEPEKKPSRVPASVKFVTALLLVLAVGGSIGVNYLKSPRGAVFLADRGAHMAYARVQRDAGTALRRALDAQGLRRNIQVVRDEKDASDKAPITWDIPCAESTDLLQVNVALTETVQAAGAAASQLGWLAGKMMQVDKADTIADGLATRSTYEMTFPTLLEGLEDFITVTDAEIADAMRMLLRTTHTMVEPAGAAGLAGLRKLAPKLEGKRVGIVLSGGNVDSSTLQRVLAGEL